MGQQNVSLSTLAKIAALSVSISELLVGVDGESKSGPSD